MLTGYTHLFACRRCRCRHYYGKQPPKCQNCEHKRFQRVELDPKTGRPLQKQTK